MNDDADFLWPPFNVALLLYTNFPILEPKTEVIFKRKLNDTRANVHTLVQRETITFILNKLVRVSFDFFML